MTEHDLIRAMAACVATLVAGIAILSWRLVATTRELRRTYAALDSMALQVHNVSTRFVATAPPGMTVQRLAAELDEALATAASVRPPRGA